MLSLRWAVLFTLVRRNLSDFISNLPGSARAMLGGSRLHRRHTPFLRRKTKPLVKRVRAPVGGARVDHDSAHRRILEAHLERPSHHRLAITLPRSSAEPIQMSMARWFGSISPPIVERLRVRRDECEFIGPVEITERRCLTWIIARGQMT